MYKLIQPQFQTANYEYDTYRLRLTFNNGDSKYDYTKVPNHVFEGLRTSESKGKFINKYILTTVYNFNKV